MRRVMTVCQSFSCVRFFEPPWTVARQASLSMEFSRQKYWSELPFSSLGNLPDLGIEPWCLAFQADSLPSEPSGKPYHWRSDYSFMISCKEIQKRFHDIIERFPLQRFYCFRFCYFVLKLPDTSSRRKFQITWKQKKISKQKEAGVTR